MAVFSTIEAKRFAVLMAGFDISNSSEPEAMNKGCALRRMVEEKNIRLVDALELEEIREAIDRQLKPPRSAHGAQAVDGGCGCEPWPVQMCWFFVGMAAWCVTGLFWVVAQMWILILELSMDRKRRTGCRNG